MYDYTLKCTYQLLEPDDPLAGDLYRTQFLQATGLSTYEDKAVSDAIDETFDMVSKERPDELSEVLSKLKHSEVWRPFVELGVSDKALYVALFGEEIFSTTQEWLSSVKTGHDGVGQFRDLLQLL